MRRLPLIAAGLALLAGLSWNGVPRLATPPGASPAADGAATTAPLLPGFRTVAERSLVGAGRHRLFTLADAQGCILQLAALDQPEEVLPLLHIALGAEAMAGWTLLLAGTAQPGPSAFRVNLLRIQARLAGGRQAQALFLANPAHCVLQGILPGTPVAG